MTREEAVTVLKAFMENPLFSDVHKQAFNIAIKELEQEPKTGHWIYSKEINTLEIIWSECSVCGHGESGCAKRMKYCPNCGARMEEL